VNPAYVKGIRTQIEAACKAGDYEAARSLEDRLLRTYLQHTIKRGFTFEEDLKTALMVRAVTRMKHPRY